MLKEPSQHQYAVLTPHLGRRPLRVAAAEQDQHKPDEQQNGNHRRLLPSFKLIMRRSNYEKKEQAATRP
jgi:hypothetical protein